LVQDGQEQQQMQERMAKMKMSLLMVSYVYCNVLELKSVHRFGV